jgi:hypothetical protein
MASPFQNQNCCLLSPEIQKTIFLDNRQPQSTQCQLGKDYLPPYDSELAPGFCQLGPLLDPLRLVPSSSLLVPSPLAPSYCQLLT